jgi:hypothetical protein
MKINRSLRQVCLVVVVLGCGLWAIFPTPFAGQKDSMLHSNPHDLNAQVKLFNNYSTDFEAMEKPIHGEELQVIQFLNQVAKTAEDRLYALDAELQMYDSISCEPDRVKAKRILKGQLGYYAWLFDSEITRTTGVLTFSKVPVAVQTGLRMKDDLRAAKDKLDAVSASLN